MLKTLWAVLHTEDSSTAAYDCWRSTAAYECGTSKSEQLHLSASAHIQTDGLRWPGHKPLNTAADGYTYMSKELCTEARV